MSRIKQVLVVEDDISMLDILTKILKAEKYDVVKAKSGKDALFALELNPNAIDLILCDIMMEQMDGIDLLRKIKDTPHWKSIPFIFLTGKKDAYTRSIAMRAGADEYLQKPLNKEELLEKVKLHLGKITHARKKLMITGLSGDIEDTSLRDLFRAMNLMRKTGALGIRNSATGGAFYFNKGVLVNAFRESSGPGGERNIWGKEGIAELVKISEGTFQFEPRSVDDIPVVFAHTYIDELMNTLTSRYPDKKGSDVSVADGLKAVKPIDNTLSVHETAVFQLVAINNEITPTEITKILGHLAIPAISSLLKKGYISAAAAQSQPKTETKEPLRTIIRPDNIIEKIQSLKKKYDYYGYPVGIIGSKENISGFLDILSQSMDKIEKVPFHTVTKVSSDPDFNIFKGSVENINIEFRVFYYEPDHGDLFNDIFKPVSGLVVLYDGAIAPEINMIINYAMQYNLKYTIYDTGDKNKTIDIYGALKLVEQVI